MQFEVGDLVTVDSAESPSFPGKVMGIFPGRVSIRWTHPSGAYEIGMVQIRQVCMHEKEGGLSPNQLADKRHRVAMKEACGRRMSYVEAMEGHGYTAEMKPVRQRDNRTIRWDMVLLKGGQPVYTTVFFQHTQGEGRCSQYEDCPARAESTALELWRCCWRWSDIEDCPEGPKYQSKLETSQYRKPPEDMRQVGIGGGVRPTRVPIREPYDLDDLHLEHFGLHRVHDLLHGVHFVFGEAWFGDPETRVGQLTSFSPPDDRQVVPIKPLMVREGPIDCPDVSFKADIDFSQMHWGQEPGAAEDLAESLKEKGLLPEDAQRAWFTGMKSKPYGEGSNILKEIEMTFVRRKPPETDE